MPRTTPDFVELLEAVTREGVDFVLVGGLAMVAHGSNHVTTDIDLAISREQENAKRIAKALAPFDPRPENFPPELPYIWDVETVRRATILTLLTSLGSVDLLGEAPGAPVFRSLKERAVQVEIYGHKIFVASVEDLIAMKRAANRPKDQGHIQELLALKSLMDEETNQIPEDGTSLES